MTYFYKKHHTPNKEQQFIVGEGKQYEFVPFRIVVYHNHLSSEKPNLLFLYEYFKCDYHNITAAEIVQNATLTLSVLLHLACGALTFRKQHTFNLLINV